MAVSDSIQSTVLGVTQSTVAAPPTPPAAFHVLARRIALGVAAGLFLGSHALQSWMSYASFEARGPDRFESRPTRYGSYGVSLTRFPQRPPGSRTVVMLGNSVYQACQIVETMQEWANRDRENVCFVNLAQTGSGIYDYIVNFARAMQLKPDLVVISFINLGFTATTPDGGSLPNFRTDADQMVFDPDVLSWLPRSFLRREFSFDALCSSLVSTLLPVRRLDPILRATLYQALERRNLVPGWIKRLGPVPALNLAGDWLARTARTARVRAVALPQTAQLVSELLEMACATGTPLLLLRQQSGPPDDTPDVIPLLRSLTAGRPGVWTVDLRHHFAANDYIDYVHPHHRARAAYAQLHYRAIMPVLSATHGKASPAR
jgi:hypothetical protein